MLRLHSSFISEEMSARVPLISQAIADFARVLLISDAILNAVTPLLYSLVLLSGNLINIFSDNLITSHLPIIIRLY